MRSWIAEGDTIPWIVERGGERAPETMETNAAISGVGMTPQVPQDIAKVARWSVTTL
jgi:hypothetical protein